MSTATVNNDINKLQVMHIMEFASEPLYSATIRGFMDEDPGNKGMYEILSELFDAHCVQEVGDSGPEKWIALTDTPAWEAMKEKLHAEKKYQDHAAAGRVVDKMIQLAKADSKKPDLAQACKTLAGAVLLYWPPGPMPDHLREALATAFKEAA